MSLIVKHFKHASGRLHTYRALIVGDNESPTQGADLTGEEGWSQLTQSEYDAEMVNIRAANKAKNDAAAERAGVLSQLAAKADDILGGLLGGIV